MRHRNAVRALPPDRTVDLFLSFKVSDPELLNPRVEVTVSVQGEWEYPFVLYLVRSTVTEMWYRPWNNY